MKLRFVLALALCLSASTAYATVPTWMRQIAVFINNNCTLGSDGEIIDCIGGINDRGASEDIDPSTVRLGCIAGSAAACQVQLRVGEDAKALDCDANAICSFDADTLVIDPVTRSVTVNGDDVCVSSGINCPSGLGGANLDVNGNGAADKADGINSGTLDCTTADVGTIKVVSGVPTICVP